MSTNFANRLKLWLPMFADGQPAFASRPSSLQAVLSYELGWESSFIDNHIRTQINAFCNNDKGFHANVVETSTGFSGVENISSAKIKGIEAQIHGKLGGFGFDASVAYVGSELASVTLVNVRNGLPSGTLGPQCPVGAPSAPHPVTFT